MNKKLVKRYLFKEPWRFILKIKPNMIDKIKKQDLVLEKRLAEISDYMDRNDLRNRQNKIVHGFSKRKFWKEFEKPTEAYEFKNKKIEFIIDKINEI